MMSIIGLSWRCVLGSYGSDGSAMSVLNIVYMHALFTIIPAVQTLMYKKYIKKKHISTTTPLCYDDVYDENP